MIEISRLTKDFGTVHAVRDLSFIVRPGRVTGLLGPNGAGKTTTLRCVLGGACLATTLYAVVGVAVGALVRNQIAALIGALVWVLLIEGLLVALVPEVGKWLPGGAANAALQTKPLRGELLPPWAGALLFLAYGIAFAILATRTTLRSDVT